jgi:hypothetical protein
METLDTSNGPLLILLIIGAILLLALFILKAVFKLTITFIKFGCLAISIILLLIFFIMLMGPAV